MNELIQIRKKEIKNFNAFFLFKWSINLSSIQSNTQFLDDEFFHPYNQSIVTLPVEMPVFQFILFYAYNQSIKQCFLHCRSIELEDFANSRLYTNLPLFDTPPADYIAPYQKIVAGSGAMQTQSQTQQAPKRTGSMNIQSGSSQRGGGRPAAATTHAAQSAGRSDDNSGSGDQSSGASGDQSSAASGDQQTGGQTGAMDQQGGAPAAAASGNAQSGGSGAGDQSGGSSAGQGAGDQSSGSGAGQGAGDQSGGSGAGQGAGDQSGGSGAGQSAGDQSTTPSS